MGCIITLKNFGTSIWVYQSIGIPQDYQSTKKEPWRCEDVCLSYLNKDLSHNLCKWKNWVPPPKTIFTPKLSEIYKDFFELIPLSLSPSLILRLLFYLSCLLFFNFCPFHSMISSSEWWFAFVRFLRMKNRSKNEGKRKTKQSLMLEGIVVRG